MLDNIRPYKMIFIQKASPNVGDAFDFAYIYKFYSNRKEAQSETLGDCVKILIFAS